MVTRPLHIYRHILTALKTFYTDTGNRNVNISRRTNTVVKEDRLKIAKIQCRYDGIKRCDFCFWLLCG